MVAIAIDLGTTYTCAAVWKNNNIEVITNEQGNRFTPSYVAFSNKERLIGEAAKNQASINPTNTIFGAKRLIGRRYDDVNLQMDLRHFPFSVVNCKGKPKIVVQFKGKKMLFAPEEISAMIIFRMKQMAEGFLGAKVTSAVITVPAYFNDSQRQATRLAGVIAELNVIRIINEPTAAALMYGMNQKINDDKNILVFDLGGGTLDVSILTIGKGSVYEVKATSGNLRLGGDDFDNRLISFFVQDFLKCYGVEIKQACSLRRLKTAAESVKCCLTSANVAKVQIESIHDDIDYSGCVSRVLFEDLCSDLFDDSLKPILKALKGATMSKNDIHDVILVGGSTRIPKIRKVLSDFFDNKSLTCSVNPDEAIACGAAIQAAILSGDCAGIKDLLLIDVVSLSLGVETARGMMYTVIERNTPIPCRRVKDLTTLEDYQTTMTIEVFEGERSLTKDNHLLGVFELDKIPPVPRGVAKIDIVFDIDVNGILTVSAQDKSTGNSESITIERKNRLTGEEVSKMISDARKFLDEDVENKRCLEVRNQLETYIYDVKRLVTDNLVKLSGEECAFMIGECKNALTWLEENPDCLREEYERKLSELLRHWSANIRKLNGYQVKRRKGNSEVSDVEDPQSTVIEEVVEEN